MSRPTPRARDTRSGRSGGGRAAPDGATDAMSRLGGHPGPEARASASHPPEAAATRPADAGRRPPGCRPRPAGRLPCRASAGTLPRPEVAPHHPGRSRPWSISGGRRRSGHAADAQARAAVSPGAARWSPGSCERSEPAAGRPARRRPALDDPGDPDCACARQYVRGGGSGLTSTGRCVESGHDVAGADGAEWRPRRRGRVAPARGP